MITKFKKLIITRKETNHDIQALIMYIKNKLPENYREYVHFGLTSQDINNPAMVMMHREFNFNLLKTDLDNIKFTFWILLKIILMLI